MIPETLSSKSNNWIFGCDICQDVCPWNRFSKTTTHDELKPISEVLSFSIDDWYLLEKEAFNKLFKESAIKRTKWEGMKRNLSLYIKEDPIT